MKRAYLDHVAINDITYLLGNIHQHKWTLEFDRELTDAERLEEIKNIMEQAKDLAKTAKALYKEFSYNAAILSD